MKSIRTNRKIAMTIYVVVMMLVTTAIAVGVYDFRTKTGVISIGDQQEEISTKSSTVGQLLQEQNIILKQDDYISESPEAELKDDFNIEIRRAIPVTLNLKDGEVKVVTTEKTVKDLLNSLSVFYNKGDKITPALDAKLVENMQVTVINVEEKVQTVQSEIDFQVETSNNSKLEKGKTLVVQEGIKGIKESTVKEIYENGKLISSETMATKIVREPIKKIVQKGTKVNPPARASRSGEGGSNAAAASGSLQGARSIVMKASAYDLSYASTGKNPGDKYYGITASGTKVRPGVVAVDPSVIPLGSKLYIESMDGTKSYGYASAEDKGGAIKGNRIDLFHSSREAALSFGRRNVRVYILN